MAIAHNQLDTISGFHCYTQSMGLAIILLGIFSQTHSPVYCEVNSTDILRVMTPIRTQSAAWDAAFQAQISAFQAAHPRFKVQWTKRGKDFSSLPEFVAAGFMGEQPDVFLVESSEAQALEQTKQAILHPRWIGAALTLFGDQELLFRHHVDPYVFPQDWNALSTWVATLSTTTARPLGVPLMSSRGLWLLEALSYPEPWWKRQTGGIRFERKQLQWIERLRKSAQVQLGWDEAVQQFLSRKTPLVLGSSEWEPMFKERAEFRFGSKRWSGPMLVFRWAQAGKSAASDAWVRWMHSPKVVAALTQGTGLLDAKSAPTLPSDPHILNLYNEWSRALRDLFSPTKTESDEAILAELEHRLSQTTNLRQGH